MRGPESKNKFHIDGIYSDFGLTKESFIQSITESKGLLPGKVLKKNMEAQDDSCGMASVCFWRPLSEEKDPNKAV